MDAILCAHLAWLWRHQPAVLQVYGDATSGYIVAPPPPTHPHTPLVPRHAGAVRGLPVPRP